MAERLEEQSFHRCDAAPRFFANSELNVFIEVQWHWTETWAGSGSNEHFTENPIQNLDSVREWA